MIKLKAVANLIKIKPLDYKGICYVDEFGNLYDRKLKLLKQPYIAEVDLSNSDDVLNIHASELGALVERIKRTNPSTPELQQRKEGMLSILRYILDFKSEIDPWDDFIKSLTKEIDDDFNYVMSKED